jgi:molybdate transport system substrate-binding protein
LARRIVLALAALGLAVACGSPASDSPQTLRVAAAASLRQAVEEIAHGFEAAHPGTSVAINAAASGVLRRQIEQGNAADVFISANREHMDALVTTGRIASDSVRVLARNRLVVAVPAGSHAPLRSLAELADPAFRRIALGTPGTAPVGEYAMAALTASGVFASIESRVVYAENASQIAAYLRRSEVDAAILYATDVTALGDAADVLLEIDPVLHPPSEYSIGVVTDAPAREAATQFADYAAGEEGQQVLARFGFLPAD